MGPWQAWRGCYDRKASLPFISPMLATRLEDPRRLADPRYIAEPKLDGQRVQLHVHDYRTVHAYSRPGRELIRLPGLAWLRGIRWPVARAVLDGEAVWQATGARASRPSSRRATGRAAPWPSPRSTSWRSRATGEAWTARRKRLEDLLGAPPPGICLVPVADHAPALWDAWVGMGGEGMVLKERTSLYRPGVRSPAWLKLKPKLTLDVVVTGGSAERMR